MDLDFMLVLASTFAFTLCIICYLEWYFGGLPRGPAPVPILGNIFMLRRGSRLFESLSACRRNYGNIFTVYTGSVPSVVLSRYDLVKEALLKKGRWFAERTDSLVVPPNQKGGILWAPSPVWKEQRTFAQYVLKLMTSDATRLENIILKEALAFCAVLSSKEPVPSDITLELHRRVASVTSAILFGERFRCSDAVFNELIDHFHENTESLPSTVLSKTIPLLEYLPWDPLRLRKTRRNIERIRMLIGDIISARRLSTTSVQPCENFDNFLDHYIREVNCPKDAMLGTLPVNSFTEDNCVNCISQLMAAGTETTATVLRWAFLYVAILPHVQSKVQQEIDCIVGAAGYPSWQEHAPAMPYTRATLAEALRIGCVVPLALPRRTTGSVSVADHYLPSHIEVLVNLHSIFYDEATYAQPYCFKPERFLDEHGAYLKPESFIPFGIGKRMCIGETLAKIEMFIFFVLVLRGFVLSSPDGSIAAASARFKATIGITRQPPFYNLVARARKGV